ncbi:MAG: DUF4349 domain-containing protein [bacterium]
MLIKITAFVRKNWLSLALLLVVIYLLQGRLSLFSSNLSYSPMMGESVGGGYGKMISNSVSDYGGDEFYPSPAYESAPTDSTERMVVEDSSLSVLVDSVRDTIDKISTLAKESGGYLVNSNLSEPEGAATGNISIRVPSAKRDAVLVDIRALGLRVVDEHTTGYDVTDQYTDIEAQLATLRTTKTKFEGLLADATTVQDSLSVQRELMNLQRQIDSYVGQQKYLEGNAKLSRIAVSLSTDELSLPYAPDEPWRPLAVFRTAVRSLLSSLRGLVSILIWLGVYSPILLVIALVFWWYKRRRH